ncbi:MAG: chorismate synthase [Rhodospirillales bacterium]|nr:MAG: chorismate synthase [Rhodospirillales bacterium]
MSGNTLGHLFRVTSFGESHGPAIGCIVDGVPPRLPLTEADIQLYLDRRRPGQSRHTTQRREPDRVQILSGVFEGLTTGAPLALMIVNEDARSKDYSAIKDVFRPGHADYTYWRKYGIRDYRGGGRSSARETAMRVAAGAVARKVLGEAVSVRGALVQMGPHTVDRSRWDWDTVQENPLMCPDPAAVPAWEAFLDSVRKSSSSVGGVIEVVASGVPAGLGAPTFDRLDADLAKALISIPAAKGVEIGTGFAAAAMSGPQHNDAMRMTDGRVTFVSNHAGGVLGGISTGQDLVVRLAIKPTSSVATPQPSVDIHSHEVEVATRGRHDPCVAIRGVPVAEAMVALVLADHLLRHRAQCGETWS